MPSYNHEGTISRAIEGVLKQKTEYKYQLLIGDDSSKDNSQQIIEEYAEKYPDIIVAICRKKNLGAMLNIKDLTMKSIGEYIAICEGDDYWIDELKLQKQISFLEANPDYSACYTKCSILVDGKEVRYSFANSDSISMDDMLNEGEVKRYATCTLVTRNFYRKKPELLEYFAGNVGDLIMQTLAVKYGKIRYMDVLTGVYDKIVSSGSSFSAKPMEKQVEDARKAINICKEIAGYGFEKQWDSYLAGFYIALFWEKKKACGTFSTLKWLKGIEKRERQAVLKRLRMDYINAKREKN